MLRCCYRNTTNKFQIFAFGGLERFLLPGSSIEFDAAPEGIVTIKDGNITTILSDRISCERLVIK